MLGVWTNTQIKYDSLGRKQDVYQPYSSASNGYHRFAYDVLNRPTTDTWYSPSGTIDRTTSIAYAGLKATYTDAKGVATQKWIDVTGKLRLNIDPSPGGTTKYTYDSFGNLTRIEDATLKQTTYTYNIRGFNTAASDPDTGNSTSTPNSLNELESLVDANGQTTTFTYDKLGRMLTRLEPESATPTSWIYGTSATLKEIGRLKTVSKPDGYGESYTYDSLGRPASVTYTEDTTYQVNYTYNNIGALDVVTYPTSTSGYRLALKHNYSYGFLQQVKDNASSATYWTLNSANDYSSPVTELLGNAVTTTSGYEPLTNELTSRKVGSGGSTNNLQDLTYRWDDNGNMDRRQDLGQSLTETFTYDTLNRLKTATVTGGTPLSIDYDAAGNITSKSDVGSYDYVTNQAGCSYTGLPAQPHAVRNAGGVVYCYDKNGNMTKRGGSTISWYSYDQPNSIASGSNSTQFNYNANHQRWRQVAVDAGATTTTYYVGGILEKVVRPGGVTEYRHLIPTGSGTAIYTRRSNSTNDTFYLTTDHLGSADLVLSSSGTVLARESFTPFGERRGSNWQGLPTGSDKTVFSDVSRRGFTGHEMLDAVGLVNMNGRVYDPRIGRFLSADPIIQSIVMSQALNPYSYVMNNPLTLIDPSGYSWLSSLFSSIGKFFKRIFKSIARSLNMIVGIALVAIGTFIPTPISPLLIKAGIAISAFPVQVTYRSGRFGVSVGYSFIGSGEIWSSGGRSAPPRPTWGGGYGTVAGIGVLGLHSTVGSADPSQPARPLSDLLPTTFENGASLPRAVIDTLQPYFAGFDLTQIRIYNGIPKLVKAFAEVDPDAYTSRNRIYFAESVYDPNSASGIALIGHEILHSRQYREIGTWHFRARYYKEYRAGIKRSLSEGEAYRNISLERAAYELQAKIETDLIAAGYPR
ncbi:MAG: RHS repeat-associated core domain-containing protein [Steroidobacteraceae bacterium]